MIDRFLASTSRISRQLINSSRIARPPLTQRYRSKSTVATAYNSSGAINNTVEKCNNKSETKDLFNADSVKFYANKGLTYFYQFDTHNALINLNRSIASYDQTFLLTATAADKKLYAAALTCKAKIIRARTYDGKSIAFNLVDEALTICPDSKEAQELKEHLSAEYGVMTLKR